MSEVRSIRSEVSIDSLRSREVVTVMDTLREVTTITVVLRQPQDTSFPDDTLRMTTVTDRTRSSDRDRQMSDVRSKKEDVIVIRDTIYFEQQHTSTALQPQPSNLSPLTSITRILRWLFFILLALVALIVAARIFVFHR